MSVKLHGFSHHVVDNNNTRDMEKDVVYNYFSQLQQAASFFPVQCEWKLTKANIMEKNK